MPPFIDIRAVSLPSPSEDDRRALDQRIRDALGMPQIEIPLSVLKRLQSLDVNGKNIAFVIGRTGCGERLVDGGRERSYSLALDIGSTNLVGLLYDNLRHQDVLTRSAENPQIEFGSDILTRMHHAMAGNGEEVYRVLRNGINTLIEDLCREARVNTGEIHGMAVAGNTAMTHFFLGLDVASIPVAPWAPVVGKPGFFIASELGLAINPEAPVYVFPNAGSYVGGDITAGILASGMHRSERVSILIDVGTNAEVVIGNREWMIVGAGAAGPALEEGIARIGRRARQGVIYDVSINGADVSCRTFDRCPPEGICGSGMVSLLSELFRAGIIDGCGALRPGPHVALTDGEMAFRISCDSADALVVTQSEIQNFLKSKAAMFTLLLTLTRSVGISFREIGAVYVSGALGTGIDAAKAVGIGMLPAWPAEIVKPLGNSSLAGSRMLLADGGLADEAEELVSRITYKPMHDDPEFMKEYLGAVFIPHTHPELLKID